MIERPSDISTRYTNPNSISRGARNIITTTDPRNNALYLLLYPDTVVVDEESLPNQPVDEDLATESTFYQEGLSPEYDAYTATPNNLVMAGQAILDTPENLSVSSDSFIIEDETSSSSDGTISYLATLTFDDVPGASNYEYIIGAVN
jgi:hypothetical protein